MKKILYVNHKSQRCGVYEFGRMVGNTIARSTRFEFIYRECDNWDEFKKVYDEEKPHAVIYNYHPSTMSWISRRVDDEGYQSYEIDAVQIGTIHEVYQGRADAADNLIFDYHIAADPTLLLKNPIVYKTGRLVPRCDLPCDANSVINIGSFGFVSKNNGKGFEKVVRQVQSEFDEAVINLNISFASFGDTNGEWAKTVAASVRKEVFKPGIRLNITHLHFGENELLSFLAKNDINVFMYDYTERRGISSAPDWALAVRRPIAITKSMMLRHLFTCFPSICIEDHSLKDILKCGTFAIDRLREEWSPENLIWDYERIIGDIFERESREGRRTIGLKKELFKSRVVHASRISTLLGRLEVAVQQLRCKILPISDGMSSPWLTGKSSFGFTGFTEKEYTPVELDRLNLNRILDDRARRLYASTVNFIGELVPEVMRKKIPSANVQQGFVFDTACRLAKTIDKRCRFLAVGAFEDTAFLALQKMGVSIDAVDPNINYDLATFKTRPDVHAGDYDIILSTSVIEHVEMDEDFVRDIAFLLKPGGFAILTCDFHNGYKKGFEIPDVDCRFYTKADILGRLMASIPNCRLYGSEPEWDCLDYDFCYQNKYRYTFASIVFQKDKEAGI